MARRRREEIGFNSMQINVVIEKLINGNLFQEVAEFVAEQDKSDSKSLVIKNETWDFIEELDFSENEIISSLKSALDFKNKNKDEKLKDLDTNIETKLKALKEMKDGYKTVEKNGTKIKEKVNKVDEEVNLKLLQVLRQHVQDYDDRGAYEIINIRGMREIRFLIVDDLLYPLYRSPNNKTIYPNMVTKKKVYKVQADLAKQEFENSVTSKISSFFKNAMPFFVIGLLILNIFWSTQNMSARNKIDETIEERIATYRDRAMEAESRCFDANTLCTFYLSKFTQGNVDLLNYANEQLNLLSQELNASLNKNSPATQQQLRERVISNIIDETVN